MIELRNVKKEYSKGNAALNGVSVKIEMKYAQEDRMEAACTEALKQIEQRQYAARLKSDGMKNIVNYGIACYRKHCKVKIGKENS